MQGSGSACSECGREQSLQKRRLLPGWRLHHQDQRRWADRQVLFTVSKQLYSKRTLTGAAGKILLFTSSFYSVPLSRRRLCLLPSPLSWSYHGYKNRQSFLNPLLWGFGALKLITTLDRFQNSGNTNWAGTSVSSCIRGSLCSHCAYTQHMHTYAYTRMLEHKCNTQVGLAMADPTMFWHFTCNFPVTQQGHLAVCLSPVFLYLSHYTTHHLGSVCFVDVAVCTHVHERSQTRLTSYTSKQDPWQCVCLISKSHIRMKNEHRGYHVTVKSSWLWWRFLHSLVQKQQREVKKKHGGMIGWEEAAKGDFSVLQREEEI